MEEERIAKLFSELGQTMGDLADVVDRVKGTLEMMLENAERAACQQPAIGEEEE